MGKSDFSQYFETELFFIENYFSQYVFNLKSGD